MHATLLFKQWIPCCVTSYWALVYSTTVLEGGGLKRLLLGELDNIYGWLRWMWFSIRSHNCQAHSVTCMKNKLLQIFETSHTMKVFLHQLFLKPDSEGFFKTTWCPIKYNLGWKKEEKRQSYTGAILKMFPTLLHELYRYATSVLGASCKTSSLIHIMNRKPAVLYPNSPIRSNLKLTKHHF